MTAQRRNLYIGGTLLVALLAALIVPNFRRAAAALSHPDPIGPTVYSKSAIGHSAFRDLLGQLDILTEISEEGSGVHVGPSDVLVVGEPRSDSTTLREVKAMLEARTVLLVLPKRTGKPDNDRPYWLANDSLVAPEDANAVLHLVDPRAEIARVSSMSAVAGEIGGGPSIHKPQLMRHTDMRPMLATPEGILMAERRIGARRIVVLSDPDIISNHALATGDNSVIAAGLIENLRNGREDGTVIFDEFVHGFTPKPLHLLGILFQFPFNLVTMQIAFGVALLAWAATARFGAPAALEPPLEAGKRSLIDTGARLLTNSGRYTEFSERYVEAIVADTARALRIPISQVPDLPASPTPQQIWQWRKKLLGEPRANTKLD
ncbi:MAG TPA: DUF4350 domain-containing protein [Candidatus Solibacter sp.]|nr:DUF4350 domain-containing protein [Candidatus Solibacter sp.]